MFEIVAYRTVRQVASLPLITKQKKKKKKAGCQLSQ